MDQTKTYNSAGEEIKEGERVRGRPIHLRIDYSNEWIMFKYHEGIRDRIPCGIIPTDRIPQDKPPQDKIPQDKSAHLCKIIGGLQYEKLTKNTTLLKVEKTKQQNVSICQHKCIENVNMTTFIICFRMYCCVCCVYSVRIVNSLSKFAEFH